MKKIEVKRLGEFHLIIIWIKLNGIYIYMSMSILSRDQVYSKYKLVYIRGADALNQHFAN